MRSKNLGKVLPRAEHGQPMNTLTYLACTVVDKTYRFVIIESAIVFYIANDHLARISRPIDQNTLASMHLPHAMIEAAGQPTAPHEENQQQGINDKNRQRIFYEAQAPMDQNVKNSGARENSINDIPEIPNTGITPESLVKPQGNKDELLESGRAKESSE